MFEAQTLCVKEHNLGLACTSGVDNLSFFSRRSRITKPLKQNLAPLMPYNKSKTYIALVVGDGDNMLYDKVSRFEWFHQRLAHCEQDPSYKGCFPLLWTLSPHLLHLAPEMIEWYYNASYRTKSDYFVLPPSGDLYSYPSLFSDANQATFVANTEDDCTLMDCAGTTAWEFMFTWGNAIENYFPRYAAKGVITSLFAGKG